MVWNSLLLCKQLNMPVIGLPLNIQPSQPYSRPKRMLSTQTRDGSFSPQSPPSLPRGLAPTRVWVIFSRGTFEAYTRTFDLHLHAGCTPCTLDTHAHANTTLGAHAGRLGLATPSVASSARWRGFFLFSWNLSCRRTSPSLQRGILGTSVTILLLLTVSDITLLAHPPRSNTCPRQSPTHPQQPTCARRAPRAHQETPSMCTLDNHAHPSDAHPQCVGYVDPCTLDSYRGFL
ncbi:hypothetical protein BJV77DRAFT_1022440 [Russula vinacea]|nr:hypothetical protein BJV77DRAFT_1022440 [Russula vinacea]